MCDQLLDELIAENREIAAEMGRIGREGDWQEQADLLPLQGRRHANSRAILLLTCAATLRDRR